MDLRNTPKWYNCGMVKRYLFLLMLFFTAGCAPASPIPTATSVVPPELQTAAVQVLHQSGENTGSGTALPIDSEKSATDNETVLTTPVADADVKDINPLTGLVPGDKERLNHRPVIVKVQNVPRESRPQWGVSLADIVYEYYIEYGDTRFAAVFYSQQPEMIGPIRSARHVDIHLIRMYKAIFVFGGAYDNLLKLLWESEFGDRLVREGPNTNPALYRFEPKLRNYLILDSTLLGEVIDKYDMDDSRQDLSGMHFDKQAPAGGEDAQQVYVRFSGGMYHYWEYESESGRYTRYSETQDDIDRKKEVYALHTDQLTGKPLQADNVVVILVNYSQLPEEESEVYNVDLTGSGEAYLMRDGELFHLRWQRENEEDILTLIDENGTPFAFKPGQTWFELLGSSSQVQQQEDGIWRFSFLMP